MGRPPPKCKKLFNGFALIRRGLNINHFWIDSTEISIITMSLRQQILWFLFIVLDLNYSLFMGKCQHIEYTHNFSGIMEWSENIADIFWAEMWWWQGWDVRVGAGRLGENVWRMIWMSWLNGWRSGICGEASYRSGKTSVEVMDVFKINGDDNDDDDETDKNQFLFQRSIARNSCTTVLLEEQFGIFLDSWQTSISGLLDWCCSARVDFWSTLGTDGVESTKCLSPGEWLPTFRFSFSELAESFSKKDFMTRLDEDDRGFSVKATEFTFARIFAKLLAPEYGEDTRINFLSTEKSCIHLIVMVWLNWYAKQFNWKSGKQKEKFKILIRL